MPLRRRRVLHAKHTLREGLVEKRKRFRAGGVGHAAQGRAGNEVGRAELLKVVAELVHRGVEAVPAEFGIKT